MPVEKMSSRGEVITASPRDGEFAPLARTNVAEKYAMGVNLGNPGRLGLHDSPVKPAAEDTPWRSTVFVGDRHSADGNAYARGEPIPLAEAVRQGIARPDGSKAGRSMRIPKASMTCPKCRGLRHAVGKDRRGVPHANGCSCTVCVQPCGECQGSGFVAREEGA